MTPIILSVRMSSIIQTGSAMGHSQADKAETHDRLLRLAAARLREAGPAGLGVAELMQAAGLTHGGFYKHFASREALIEQALASALAHGEERVARLQRRGRGAAADAAQADDAAPAALAALIDGYLGTAHRDAPASGCAVVALASDMPRATPAARAAYTAQLRRTLQRFGGAGEDAAAVRVRVATLVGALALARAVDDDKLSRQILRDAATALKAGLKEPS